MPKTEESTEGTKPPWLKNAGLGFELFGAVAGFSLLGLWIDWHYGTSPKALMICAAIGLIGGLYNFIRTALKLLKPPDRTDRNAEDG